MSLLVSLILAVLLINQNIVSGHVTPPTTFDFDELNATSTLYSPPRPPQLSLDNILSLLGYSKSRQAEAAVLSHTLSSFLGLIATGKIIPLIVPVIVGYLILPLMALMKTAAKGLLLMAIVFWLIASMVPFALGYFGLTATAFVSRAMESSSYLHYISVGPGMVTEKALHYANMDSKECRMMIACKAGELATDNYPEIIHFINTTGIVTIAEHQASERPFTRLAIKALRGEVNCHRDLPPCHGLFTIESLFDSQRVVKASQVWAESFIEQISTTSTTTTPSPPTTLATNELIMRAIKNLAQNYYTYDTTK